MIRQQPPAYSPLTLSAILGATVGRARRGTDDPRLRLTAVLRERFSRDDAVLCGSGTQALQVALEASPPIPAEADRIPAETDRIPAEPARIPAEAHSVALPAFTCYDVASAAVGAGTSVRFYDVDPKTLTPDLGELEACMEAGARVVVVAPLYGLQPDWDAIREAVGRHDALLIEDAAQSFGSRWKGRPAGSLGDLAVLSFGRGKGWTGTTGGALMGPTELLVEGRRALEDGREAPGAGGSGSPGGVLLRGLAQWALGRPWTYGIPKALPGLALGETVYHPPRNPTVMEASAAELAVRTLGISEEEADRRRSIAGRLRKRLADEEGRGFRVPEPIPGSDPGFLRLPILLDEAPREREAARLRRVGIFPTYPKPLPELAPIQDRMAGGRPSVPGARELARRLFTLPTHSLQSERDLERVVSVLLAALSRRGRMD